MDAQARSWHIVMEFTGVDLTDDAVTEALAPKHSVVMFPSSSGDITTIDATVDATSFVEALVTLVDAVRSAPVPECVAIRLVDPLVSISDIAEEAGVTRQAARNWSTGTRQRGFPSPLTMVGDGTFIWRLADIEAWLDEVLNLGQGRSYPSPLEIASVNERLAGALINESVANDEGGSDLLHADWHEVSSASAIHRINRP